MSVVPPPLCLPQSVKKFPCHLCERSFCSAPSLRRHVRVNHEGIKRVYPCRYRFVLGLGGLRSAGGRGLGTGGPLHGLHVGGVGDIRAVSIGGSG